MNNTTERIPWEPSVTASVVTLALFGVILFVGIVGNFVVVLLVLLDKTMQTTVNRSLAVLAIADLIILGFLPVQPIGRELGFDDSHLGRYMCGFLTFYDRGAVVCSVLIFFFVSIDRYVAICHPLESLHHLGGQTTYMVLLGIWIVALISSVPYVFIGKYSQSFLSNQSYFSCDLEFKEDWMIVYETAMTFLMCFLPIPLLGFLYGCMIVKIRSDVYRKSSDNDRVAHGRRGGQQVVVMLLTVVVIFIISHLPFSLYVLIELYGPNLLRNLTDSDIYTFIWVSRILIYVNSASNPIVYILVSSKFQKSFTKLFCSCRKLQSDVKTSKRNSWICRR